MKSKSILLFLLGSSLFFTSCKKTEEAPASTEQKTETTATETPAANDVSTITTTPAPAAAATQTVTPAGQPPKLNPPHGQPYHRCEIAVGAPLDGSAPAQGTTPSPVQQNAPKSFFKTVQSEQQANSNQPVATAPAKQVTPTQQAKPAPTPASTTANATGPKPKNNPAHGQPHHRCDIKVGDPLPDA